TVEPQFCHSHDLAVDQPYVAVLLVVLDGPLLPVQRGAWFVRGEPVPVAAVVGPFQPEVADPGDAVAVLANQDFRVIECHSGSRSEIPGDGVYAVELAGVGVGLGISIEEVGGIVGVGLAGVQVRAGHRRGAEGTVGQPGIGGDVQGGTITGGGDRVGLLPVRGDEGDFEG